jgi:hypothetical protein
MSKRLFTLYLLLFWSISLFAQSINSITTNPAQPNSGSATTLVVDGWLPNPCWYIAGTSSSWSGNVVTVRIDFNYNSGQICPAALVPFTQNVFLGTLAAGNYTARIVNHDTNALMFTFTFAVQQYGGSSCGTPGGLTTSSITSTSASVIWNAVAGATNYTLEYRIAGGIWAPRGTYSTPTWVTLGSSLINFSLSSNTAYEWRVRANCAGSVSSSWATASFTTLPGACIAPTVSQLTITNIGNSTATVTCTKSAPNYRFRWRKAGTNDAWVWQSNASTSNFRNLANLLSCTTYEVQCQLGCSGGSVSGFSASQIFTTTGPGCTTCNAPTTAQLSASNITQTSATLNCTAPGNAWDWQYRVLGSATWTAVTSSTNTFINLSSLSPATTYEYQGAVRCNGSNAWSTWSASKTFTTSSNQGFSNNEPCGATVITPTIGCSLQGLSTVNATQTTNPPAPVFESCPTTNMRDIWVRIPMPAGGVRVTTIAGSLTDIVVAVYAGDACQQLSAFGCVDDTNSDLMPDFQITGSVSSVWLRIWGYNGATGNFYICVEPLNGLNTDTNETKFMVNATEDRDASKMNTSENKMRLHPVPTQGPLTLVWHAIPGVSYTAEVYDLAGRLSYSHPEYTANNQEELLRLDLAELPKGAYVLRLVSATGLQQAPFIKAE